MRGRPQDSGIRARTTLCAESPGVREGVRGRLARARVWCIIQPNVLPYRGTYVFVRHPQGVAGARRACRVPRLVVVRHLGFRV